MTCVSHSVSVWCDTYERYPVRKIHHARYGIVFLRRISKLKVYCNSRPWLDREILYFKMVRRFIALRSYDDRSEKQQC